AYADENGIIVALQIGKAHVFSNSHSAFNLHAECADHLNLFERFLGAHLVGSNTVGVQAAGLGTGVKDHGFIPALAQLSGAGEAGRSSTDQGHAISVGRAGPEELHTAGDHRINGITLELADLHRLFALAVEHARAFAQD